MGTTKCNESKTQGFFFLSETCKPEQSGTYTRTRSGVQLLRKEKVAAKRLKKHPWHLFSLGSESTEVLVLYAVQAKSIFCNK